MARGLIPFDKRQLKGAPELTGIDEAGRGCLAGPVVAAAVRCSREFYASAWCRRNARYVDDSKRLSATRRADVVARFRDACRENWIQIEIGLATVGEIERHNIYGATVLAMRRALERLDRGGGDTGADLMIRDPSGPVLIDGKPIRRFPCRHEGIVKGDRQSLAIALAGIHAKEYRDAMMMELDRAYPLYGFARHKGYGTSMHLEAIAKHGEAPCHRSSFLVKFRSRQEVEKAAAQDSLF